MTHSENYIFVKSELSGVCFSLTTKEEEENSEDDGVIYG